MAYLLATPTTRVQIAFTQATVLLGSLVLITGTATLFTFIGQAIFLTEPAIHTGSFLLMNATGLFLFFAISSYCFLFSAILNDDKKAIGLSTIVTVLMYAFDLIGKLAVDFEWLRNLSLFSAFNPSELARGETSAITSMVLYLSITIVLYSLAIVSFKERDLPL